MQKVKCIKCGSTGYTASPEFLRCGECGGRHEVIPMDREQREVRIETDLRKEAIYQIA